MIFFSAQAETVITADQGVRGGKIIELKKLVDEAVKISPCVKRVLVYQRTGAEVPMGKLDMYIDKVIKHTPHVSLINCNNCNENK